MGTLQEDCNAIGAGLRDLEASIAADDGNAAALAAALHEKLAQGFADHLRPDHPELDWNAIAGAAPAGKGGMTTNAGGKHEPQPGE